MSRKPSAVVPFGVAMTPALAMIDIEGLPGGEQAIGARRDARERCEIELDQFEVASAGPPASEPAPSPAAALREIARGADDLCAVRREGARSLDAEPR